MVADAEVAAAAIVVHGRVLAARRTRPSDVAGGWELPGGKVDPGESVADAVRREVREELGCDVAYVSSLSGRSPIKTGYVLTVHRVGLIAGEVTPHEHDLVRWLGPEDLDDVSWLPADVPFLSQLRDLLLDGADLVGGNVGGAVRIGGTVRRPTGAWTPAVHALLRHVADAGLDAVPRVLGIDARGREVLTYLPGRVPDVDTELLTEGELVEAMRWLGRFHTAVRDFRHLGPWRNSSEQSGDEEICHHDYAPYNMAFALAMDGPRVVGVFDWDMAGPGTPLDDLAFSAWNMVPLWRDLEPSLVHERLAFLADAYGPVIGGDDGGVVSVERLLAAAVERGERSLRVIEAGQAAGDPGMLNLASVGEPARTREAIENLRQRIPAILAPSPDITPSG